MKLEVCVQMLRQLLLLDRSAVDFLILLLRLRRSLRLTPTAWLRWRV
jgi:hypothetical protein